MTVSYKQLISLISNGQPVDEATINNVLSQLDGNTKYLKDIFDAATLGQTTFIRSATVESSAAVGQPVFYNSTTQQFERALAVATTDPTSGQLVMADSAQVWGIVYSKDNATRADILTHGFCSLSLANSVTGTVTAGIYYLSGTAAGYLIKTKPPVGVAVLQSDGLGNVFVRPSISDVFTDHVHYKFELACVPAGTVTAPSVGQVHTITAADDSIEGWLPANHASFNGTAPTGAAFGYNIAASPLNASWPPVPIDSVYIEFDRGEDAARFGMGVPLGETGLCVVNSDGIWWMSNCYGDVPWPTALSSSDPTTTTPEPLECPRVLNMSMTIWYSKMQFQTATTAVTSLRAKAGSGLTVKCVSSGEDATSGDLELDLALDLTNDDNDATGHIVLKTLTGDTFDSGPVVEAIKVSGAIQASSAHGDATNGYQGVVTLSLIESALGRELPVEEVRLRGATEEEYEDTLAIGLPNGQNTSFRCKFQVPAELSSVTSMTVVVRMWLLARVAGSLPTLYGTYRIISRPSPSTTPTALPTSLSEQLLTWNKSGIPALLANQYAEVYSSTITVEPGDTVLFSVFRNAATSDGFNGELHVIDQRVLITSVS